MSSSGATTSSSHRRRTDPVSAVPITLKSPEQIDALRAAGRLADAVLRAAIDRCRPGISTGQIAAFIGDEIRRCDADSLFRGYRQGGSPAFPADACISINDEAVHGIPGDRRLEPGDVVSIDVGLRLNGWCADAARTVVVEPHSLVPQALADELERRRRLVEQTRRTLQLAVEMMRPGVRWSAIAEAQDRTIARAGFGLITHVAGHGIGRQLHEPPHAPSYWHGFTGPDFELLPGMVLAIEPMLTLPPLGIPADPSDRAPRSPVHLRSDGWTIATANGWIAAHEEAVVAVTSSGAEVLTDRPG